MSVFTSSDQLYRCLETLFERLRHQESAMRPLVNSRLIVRLNMSGPKAEVSVNARRRPVQVIYGPNSVRPVLDVNLTADTLHEILLDRLSVREAMSQQRVRVNGPFLKALVLVELFRHGQAVYPTVLRDIGLA